MASHDREDTDGVGWGGVATDVPTTTPEPPADRPVPPPIRRRGYRARRTGWAVVVRRSLLAIVAIVLLLAGLALFWVWKAWSDVPRHEELVGLPAPSDVEGVLLVGSDSRQDLASSEFGGDSVGGRRADTIMLLVIPPSGPATMLSVPRDLRIETADGLAKINGTFNDGPRALVDAVASATGIPVNHYVEVDFDGFRSLSEAVGGIDVCVDTAVRDLYSDLSIQEAGCYNLQGDQALAWVRSRHHETLDPASGKWKGDPTSDFGRMARQQDFLSQVLSKLGGPGTVLRLPSLRDTLANHVTVDPGFDFQHVLGLAGRFGPSLDGKLRFATLPSESKRIRGVSYVVPVEPEASQMIEAARTGAPLPEDATGE